MCRSGSPTPRSRAGCESCGKQTSPCRPSAWSPTQGGHWSSRRPRSELAHPILTVWEAAGGVSQSAMRQHWRLTVCASLVVLGSTFAACSSSAPSSSGGNSKQQVRQSNLAASAKPAVKVADQTTNGYSVTVAAVTYPKTAVPANSDDEGVVAVAPEVNGVRGDVAGFVTLHPGTSTNVQIPLNVQLTSGEYAASLYAGKGAPSSAQRPLVSTNFILTVG